MKVTERYIYGSCAVPIEDIYYLYDKGQNDLQVFDSLGGFSKVLDKLNLRSQWIIARG